ncbi:hypothetical protein [Paenibacillus campi]|nr:hypothetical protein [Paenibacillus sp. SGZ-1014]
MYCIRVYDRQIVVELYASKWNIGRMIMLWMAASRYFLERTPL